VRVGRHRYGIDGIGVPAQGANFTPAVEIPDFYGFVC
jgi:hypothetical protein